MQIKPQADRIMQTLLQLLNVVGPKSSVPDVIFTAVGALAQVLEDDFMKYMEAFTPFLYNALANQEEPAICSMAIGLVSDITRSVGDKIQPYCDMFMNYLLNTLRVGQFLHDKSYVLTLLGTFLYEPIQACHIAMLW
jgi:importin subunit beta-1